MLANKLRKLMEEELTAVRKYDKVIAMAKTVYPKVVPLLEDIRDEEVKHMGQLLAAIDDVDVDNEALIKGGIREGEAQL